MVANHNIVLGAFLFSAAIAIGLIVTSLRRQEGSSIPVLLFAGITAYFSLAAADRSDCAWAARMFSVVPAVVLVLAFSCYCLWPHRTLRRFSIMMCIVLWWSYFLSWPLLAICFTLNIPEGDPSAIKLLVSNLLFSGNELLVLASCATIALVADNLFTRYLTRWLPRSFAKFFEKREADVTSDKVASRSTHRPARLFASLIAFALFLLSVVPSRFFLGPNWIYSAATFTAAAISLGSWWRSQRRRKMGG